MSDLTPQDKNGTVKITADLDIDTLLSTYPQVASVLLRHQMACTGCYISRFHTLADIAAIYKLDIHEFLAELRSEVDAQE